MATPLGTSFYTDENTVAQADVRLLGKTVESLVVEFDQGNFEKFLSSGSASPRQCGNTAQSLLRLALESLRKLLLEWSRPIAYSAKGAACYEVLKTSRAAHAARVNVSGDPQGKSGGVDQRDGKDQFRDLLLSKLSNSATSSSPNPTTHAA